VFGIAHEKAQREGWAIWFGMCRAVYVMPENLVARLGAAICGRGSSAVQLLFSRKRLVIRNIDALNLGLPFDFAARRWARFGLVSCIVFPFAVVAVLPVIGTRWASLLQAILSV
jgi:hypothetical protein